MIPPENKIVNFPAGQVPLGQRPVQVIMVTNLLETSMVFPHVKVIALGRLT
jgi:hypothetical protein